MAHRSGFGKAHGGELCERSSRAVTGNADRHHRPEKSSARARDQGGQSLATMSEGQSAQVADLSQRIGKYILRRVSKSLQNQTICRRINRAENAGVLRRSRTDENAHVEVEILHTGRSDGPRRRMSSPGAFFEILQPGQREFPRWLQWLRIKKALSKALGPRVDGAEPDSRQSSMLLPAVRSRRKPPSQCRPTVKISRKRLCAQFCTVLDFFQRADPGWPPPPCRTHPAVARGCGHPRGARGEGEV